MTADQELEELMSYLYAWYYNLLRQYRDDGLPEAEYKIAIKRYFPHIRQAKQYYNKQDLSALRSIAKSLIYLVPPWEITVWYALNKKKSV